MSIIFAVLCAAIFMLPSIERESEGTKERAVVLSVDNANIMSVGLLKQGEQKLEVEVQSGKFKGEKFAAMNVLRAQMDLDKIFEVGDEALVGIPHGATPQGTTINAQDHYRTGWTFALLGIFAVLLFAYAGAIGVKAVLSFVFSCAVIWKIVVPLCLRGISPIAVCLGAVCVLSAAIIFLVGGLTRKGFSAFAGTVSGVLASCITGWIFAGLFKINGAVMPYSQALLYSGYEFLSLPDIYIGAIFLSSSGAVMDLSMDVAAGMDELLRRNPNLSRKKLMESGFRIGRVVVGTMTTTLLLAYSGGYLTLMMTFSAQGVSPTDFINNPYVASECVKTLVGSFGLVLVAPFTAIAGAFILKADARKARA